MSTGEGLGKPLEKKGLTIALCCAYDQSDAPTPATGPRPSADQLQGRADDSGQNVSRGAHHSRAESRQRPLEALSRGEEGAPEVTGRIMHKLTVYPLSEVEPSGACCE